MKCSILKERLEDMDEHEKFRVAVLKVLNSVSKDPECILLKKLLNDEAFVAEEDPSLTVLNAQKFLGICNDLLDKKGISVSAKAVSDVVANVFGVVDEEIVYPESFDDRILASEEFNLLLNIPPSIFAKTIVSQVDDGPENGKGLAKWLKEHSFSFPEIERKYKGTTLSLVGKEIWGGITIEVARKIGYKFLDQEVPKHGPIQANFVLKKVRDMVDDKPSLMEENFLWANNKLLKTALRRLTDAHPDFRGMTERTVLIALYPDTIPFVPSESRVNR